MRWFVLSCGYRSETKLMSSLRISLCSENAASRILNKERTYSVTQKLHLLKKLSKPLTEHDWQRKSIFPRIHESSITCSLLLMCVCVQDSCARCTQVVRAAEF